MTAEGWVIVIGAIAAGAKLLIDSWQNRKDIAATRALTEVGDAKLNKVIQLVDGPLGEALKKIANRDATISGIRGTDVDIDRAVQSRATSDAHQANAHDVMVSTDALTAATEAATAAKKL